MEIKKKFFVDLNSDLLLSGPYNPFTQIRPYIDPSYMINGTIITHSPREKVKLFITIRALTVVVLYFSSSNSKISTQQWS